MSDRRLHKTNSKASDSKPNLTIADAGTASEQHRENTNVFRRLFDTLEAEHRKLNELEKRRRKLTGEMQNLRKLLDAENKKLRTATAPSSSGSKANSSAHNAETTSRSDNQQNQNHRTYKNSFRLFKNKEKPKPPKQVAADASKMVEQGAQPPAPLVNGNEQSLQLQPPELCFGTDMDNTESVIESLRKRFDLSRAEEDEKQSMAAPNYFIPAEGTASDAPADALADEDTQPSSAGAAVSAYKALRLNDLMEMNPLDCEVTAPPPTPSAPDELVLPEPLSISVLLPLPLKDVMSKSSLSSVPNERDSVDTLLLTQPD